MKYKTINIPVKDYEFIKKYCKINNLVLTRWITSTIIEQIKKKEDVNGK